jgi:predicted NBD/HSP70 family sugar kinase
MPAQRNGTGKTPPKRGGAKKTAARGKPHSILAVDIGGSGLKILATGQSEPRRRKSGPQMTPQEMVETVREMAADWEYEAVSIGYPGQVGDHGPRSEPGNLGPGWVGFDFAAAFECPVRIVNDAAMQALGSYDGGRMLFLGLGTGLGSTLIAESVIVPLELGQLPYRGGLLSDTLGRAGLERLGKKQWRKEIDRVVPSLMAALLADYVVLGGGNAKKIKTPPGGARQSNNLTAFRGGYRLWHVDDVKTLSNGTTDLPPTPTPRDEWRMI